ncbi:glycosyltransferase [Rhodococcus sp. D2-41]|uniref:glycosyltransferase n=1 Tax=Speluncibacter jeojiensis TaxID=2710754 RepID=UPI002410B097|nr:glycosyltransferase [Rhodococcus sp. D2-41]MDG3009095.1 glycosyltransferase [Rhodococcus sp. D2-41]
MRNAPELVSVVIAALDVRDVIDVQLNALAEQDYEGAVEVVVADNGSSDGLRQHLEAHPHRERLSLRWVDASGARGVSHARNRGVAESRGDFIAFCDADDQAHPSWLRLLAAAAPDFDAVGGGLDAAALSSPRAVSWRPMADIDKQPSASNSSLPWVGGGNMGIWRTVFDAVGGWDETYLTALEDIEYSWRLQLAGHTLGWRPDAIIHYRLRDDIRSLTRQSLNYGRGEVQLYRDYRGRCVERRPIIALPLMLTLLIVRNPLLPTILTRLPRGQWLWYFNIFVGRIRGCLEYRVFYA